MQSSANRIARGKAALPPASGYTLGIPRLRQEAAQMRTGGIYWIGCESLRDADAWSRQVLGAMPYPSRAVLVACGRSALHVLDGLPDDAGPRELRLYSATPGTARGGHPMQALGYDMHRKARPWQEFVLLSVAADAWRDLDDAALARWCERWRSWLRTARSTLLVVAHGESAAGLVARLHPCNEALSGLALLYRRDGAPQYLVRHWRNHSGAVAGLEVALCHDEATGYAPAPEQPPAILPDGNDAERYLVQADVLEGAPPLSEFWETFADGETLFQRAMQAQSATVVYSVRANAEVAPLARSLHRLRLQRGRALKLVVREMTSCLRHTDEHVLLACGANLIAPAGTTLARFLTMLESVQGQTYPRDLPADPEQLLRRTQPPDVRGAVSVSDFVAHLRAMLKNDSRDSVGGVLVVLQPVPSVSLGQALGQCRLNRRGDFACAADGQVFLFLFACQPNSVETALRNVFRIPYRELFQSRSVYDSHEQMLAQVADLLANVPEAQASAPPAPEPEPPVRAAPDPQAPPPALRPVAEPLPLSGVRP